MALGHMGNFMGQHPRQFRLVLHRQDQAGIDTDITAEHGKGIDHRVLQGKK